MSSPVVLQQQITFLAVRARTHPRNILGTFFKNEADSCIYQLFYTNHSFLKQLLLKRDRVISHTMQISQSANQVYSLRVSFQVCWFCGISLGCRKPARFFPCRLKQKGFVQLLTLCQSNLLYYGFQQLWEG